MTSSFLENINQKPTYTHTYVCKHTHVYTHRHTHKKNILLHLRVILRLLWPLSVWGW